MPQVCSKAFTNFEIVTAVLSYTVSGSYENEQDNWKRKWFLLSRYQASCRIEHMQEWLFQMQNSRR